MSTFVYKGEGGQRCPELYLRGFTQSPMYCTCMYVCTSTYILHISIIHMSTNMTKNVDFYTIRSFSVPLSTNVHLLWTNPFLVISKPPEKKPHVHLYFKAYYSRFVVAKSDLTAFFARIFMRQQGHIIIFEKVNHGHS